MDKLPPLPGTGTGTDWNPDKIVPGHHMVTATNMIEMDYL